MALVADLHRLPRSLKQALFSAPRMALFGYLPDEATTEAWQDSLGNPIYRCFSGDRRRNYAAFDVALFPDELGRPIDCSLPAAAERLGPEVHAVTSELYAVLNRVSADLLLLASAPGSRINAAAIAGPTCSVFRALRYTRGPSGRMSKAHRDYELAALIVSSAPGLEVQGPDGGWRLVASSPSEAVLLPGEMLELASGGTVRAAEHRVRTEGGRLSAIVFQGLQYDTPVGLPGGESLRFGDHLLSRFVMGRPDLVDAIDAGMLQTDFRLIRENPFRRR